MTIETDNTNTIKTTKPRRWFRFRLRTLLVMVTLLTVPLGWVGWELDQRRQEKEVVAWVEEMGGEAHPHRKGFDNRTSWEKTKDKWFGESEQVWDFVLANSQVSDLSPLAELKNLRSLDLNLTQVSDLSPLAELKKLEELVLYATQVSDLSPLAELKSLIVLELSNTQVSDLSPLAELKNLAGLGLDGTLVSDLSPLAELKNLEVLLLNDCSVNEEQVQELRLALPNCTIVFDRQINDQRNPQQ
jgi:hypothetical protein